MPLVKNRQEGIIMYKHTSHFSIIKALNRYAVWKLLFEVNLTLKLASQTLKQSSPSRWRFINHNPIGGQVLIFGWMRGVLVYISSLSMCKFRNGTPFSFNVTCYSDFLNNTTFIQSIRLHQVMSLYMFNNVQTQESIILYKKCPGGELFIVRTN